MEMELRIGVAWAWKQMLGRILSHDPNEVDDPLEGSAYGSWERIAIGSAQHLLPLPMNVVNGGREVRKGDPW